MKANEFIKKHGWERAKVLLRAKDLSIPVLKAIYKKEDLVWMQRVLVGGDLMNMDDLRKYLKAYELVQHFGGLDLAKNYFKNHRSDYLTLQISIQLVEECQ